MKKSVLVVGAEPKIYRQISTKLPAQTYEVLCAGNTQDALDHFDVSLIDLLLMDMDVPTAQGWSALPPLTQVNPRLLVLGLTERSDARGKALDAHLSAVAEKPVDVRALLGTIEQLLGKAPGAHRFRYLPPRTADSRGGVSFRAANSDRCPAAYSGWGIND